MRSSSPSSATARTSDRRCPHAANAYRLAQLMGRRRQNDPLSELTPREREVLTLMAEGLSNAAIAKRLWLTVGAVEKHISSIFARLGLYPGEDENRRVRAVLTYLEGVRG